MLGLKISASAEQNQLQVNRVMVYISITLVLCPGFSPEDSFCRTVTQLCNKQLLHTDVNAAA